MTIKFIFKVLIMNLDLIGQGLITCQIKNNFTIMRNDNEEIYKLLFCVLHF